MALDEQLVVHLVDVIASKDHNQLGAFLFNGINVLIHGIGRSLIPVFVDALLRRDNIDAFAHLPTEIPTPS